MSFVWEISMFSTKKDKTTSLALGQDRFDTLVGRHTEIHGKLVLHESVRIDGLVVGNIEDRREGNHTLVIGATGEVRGDIQASRVLVAGKVAGQIHAIDRVELHEHCQVLGDIKYGSIAIAHGASVQGLLLQIESAQEEREGLDAQEAIRRAQLPGPGEHSRKIGPPAG
jgi:cytoskeletal protein CcmA (bactofilin family)